MPLPSQHIPHIIPRVSYTSSFLLLIIQVLLHKLISGAPTIDSSTLFPCHNSVFIVYEHKIKYFLLYIFLIHILCALCFLKHLTKHAYDIYQRTHNQTQLPKENRRQHVQISISKNKFIYCKFVLESSPYLTLLLKPHSSMDLFEIMGWAWQTDSH